MNQIVPADLALEAMRDNGYRNTAYAVCELIDNAIQAGANYVHLMCAERVEQNNVRITRKISQIAVLDDGCGMDKQVLSIALQFGNGTRLKRQDRTGIGRFGMGLPASSISQARRVEVWSWQNGIENALYTYLDMDEIKKENRSEVPVPIRKAVPDCWITHATVKESGTLVVWSKIDRNLWKQAKTLFDNSELLIGRTYRKFLNDKTIVIEMLSFDEDTPKIIEASRKALPNDPLYLMTSTSCPPPYDAEALFEPWGEPRVFSVDLGDGKKHEIIIRCSIAKAEARKTDNAGGLPYGKHAAKNVGISLMRAGRELELDQTIVNAYDPRERWWGIEVDFPPALDEIMGVANNKQTARNFADILQFDVESLIKDGKTFVNVMEELEGEGDPRAPLLVVCVYLKNQLALIRKIIKEQGVGKRQSGDERYSSDRLAVTAATIATDQRKEDGFKGISDKDETKPKEQREKEIEEFLEEAEVPEDEAKAIMGATLENGLKYLFAKAPVHNDAFFVVQPKGGVLNILINIRHPAYEHLVEVLDNDFSNDDADELKARLIKAGSGLKLLLAAWARYEDELPDGPQKERAQDARADWGRVARGFLKSC